MYVVYRALEERASVAPVIWAGLIIVRAGDGRGQGGYPEYLSHGPFVGFLLRPGSPSLPVSNFMHLVPTTDGS